MSKRSSVLQGARVGPESSFGAGGSANISLRSFNVEFSPNVDIKEIRAHGYRVPTNHRFDREWAEWSIADGQPDYNEIGYPMAMLETPTTATIATGVYRHTFLPDVRGCTVPKSHQIEKGDGCSAEYEAILAAVAKEFNFSYSRGETGFGGSGFSQPVNFEATPTAGANEVQTLTLSGTPTGGDFKLEFKGAVTAVIAHNAAAATVQTALQALSTIGSGNATVSGSAGGPWTVTFAGTLAGLAQPLLSLADNDLTGGTSPSMTIVKATKGGYTERTLAPIKAGHAATYMHTTAAGMLDVANLLSETVDNVEYSLDSGISPQWASGSTNHIGTLEGEASFAVSVTLVADTAGKAWSAQLRNGAKVYMRSKFTGDVIGSGESYFLECLGAYQISNFEGFEDSDGLYAVKFQLTAVWDETLGFAQKWILQNSVASY